MKLAERQQLFAYNVALLITYIHSKGCAVSFGEAYRPQEMADIYAKQGKGIHDSLHCQKLAIDLNAFSTGGTYMSHTQDYADFGAYWESLHLSNRWGGNFRKYGGKIDDGNHFQMNDK